MVGLSYDVCRLIAALYVSLPQPAMTNDL
jgi:hypothetical protein